jgi:hypothetical protein
MSRSSAIQRVLGSPDFSVRSIPANGDCLYHALAIAQPSAISHTVESLRALVADALTDDTFYTYKAIALSGCPGTVCFHNCEVHSI